MFSLACYAHRCDHYAVLKHLIAISIRSGLANLFRVECQYLDLKSHKIFGVPRQKNKEYWAILIKLLFFVQRRCLTFFSYGAAIKSVHSSRIEASTVRPNMQ